jgi:DNA polymerase III alpha subunit
MPAMRVVRREGRLQRPGPAKGIAFASLEDEHGLANLLLYPDAYERNWHALRASPVVIAEGVVQHEKGALHLVTDRVVPVQLDGTTDGVAPDDIPGPAKEFE